MLHTASWSGRLNSGVRQHGNHHRNVKPLKPDPVQISESVALIPIPESCLHLILQCQTVELPGLAVADGALPPAHVARRSLDLLESGCPPVWATPFNIVDLSRQMVVGGCGFKGEPVSGSIEIGYAVAPSCHRRGYAAAAVGLAQAIAARSGIVREIAALVAPDNVPSAMLLARSGFIMGPEIFDAYGERVVRWHWACVA
jgi:ribosomal-protein-alanine N-acetyltransferase